MRNVRVENHLGHLAVVVGLKRKPASGNRWWPVEVATNHKHKGAAARFGTRLALFSTSGIPAVSSPHSLIRVLVDDLASSIRVSQMDTLSFGWMLLLCNVLDLCGSG